MRPSALVLGVSLLVASVSIPFAALTGCGGGNEATNPLGGPVNTGGKPDVDKSHGTVGPGGDVNTGGTPDVNKSNTGGTPDVNKSHGTISTGGPVNTAGTPSLGKDKDGGK